jgi:DNA-binding NarL/FixJ family response regulator
MKIILADDQPEVLSAIRLFLEQDLTSWDIREVSDFDSLLNHIMADCPDIILLSWELLRNQSRKLMDFVHSNCTPLTIIAMIPSIELGVEALSMGVNAYISKGDLPEKFLQVLHTHCAVAARIDRRSESVDLGNYT